MDTNLKVTAWEVKPPFPSGKQKGVANIEDGQNVHSKVDVWKNDLSFDEIAVGTVLVGHIKTQQNGQYENKTFVPAVKAPAWATKKPSGMVTAVKEKAASISKAMDRKEDSIALNSANRDATIFMQVYTNARAARGEEITIEGMKNLWVDTRKWLLDNNGSDQAFI